MIGEDLVTWPQQYSPLIGAGGQLQPGARSHRELGPHPHLLLHREPQRQVWQEEVHGILLRLQGGG